MEISIQLDLAVLLCVHHSPFALVIARICRTWLPITLCQVVHANPVVVLNIIGVNETLPVAVAVHEGNARGASARLHRSPSLEAGYRIGGYSLVVKLGIDQVAPVRVMAGKIEKIHSREDDEESTEQGDCVHCIGGVEPLEEDERSAERSRRESNIVEGVDTIAAMFVSNQSPQTSVHSRYVQLTSRSRRRSMPC